MWGLFLVQWLHVLLSIFWFGGMLYLNVVVVPTLLKMPLEQQRPVTAALGLSTSKIFMPVQALVIVFGLLRGTLYGPIDSIAALGTPYGTRFLVSLVSTLALAGFGHGVSGRAARKLGTFPMDEVAKGTGPIADAYRAQASRVKTYVGVQLLAFLFIYTLMILMRFGM